MENLIKWMIWGYPYFWKHPSVHLFLFQGFSCSNERQSQEEEMPEVPDVPEPHDVQDEVEEIPQEVAENSQRLVEGSDVEDGAICI